MTKKSHSIGLELPSDLDTDRFDGIAEEALAKLTDQRLNGHFRGGWRGVGYRFRAAADSSDRFTKSVTETPAASAGGGDIHYLQETELFTFFVSGLAALESFVFAVHALAASVDRNSFPIDSDADLKKINPARTARLLSAAFPREALTAQVNALVNDSSFEAWNVARNILAHRIVPGRAIRYELGTEASAAEVTWTSIRLDVSTTTTRLSWLVETLNALMRSTEGFIDSNLP